jgi:hypothetical protein
VACLPGEYHELGVLLYCIAAIGRGYRILYLGTSLPLDQVPLVVARTGVAGVLLSGSSSAPWPAEMETAVEACIHDLQVPAMFGGESADIHADDITRLGGHGLGADHVAALDAMETIVPAFSPS